MSIGGQQSELDKEEAEVERFQNKGQAAVGAAKKGISADDPNWRIKTVEGATTLADVKRRQREEIAEQLEDSTLKRFKIVNFTSEDSIVVGERNLRSFYCSICGEYSVASEADVAKLPRRSTDKAR